MQRGVPVNPHALRDAAIAAVVGAVLFWLYLRYRARHPARERVALLTFVGIALLAFVLYFTLSPPLR